MLDCVCVWGQDFLPRWKETPETAPTRHPETSEGVAMALVDLCIAQASTDISTFVNKETFVSHRQAYMYLTYILNRDRVREVHGTSARLRGAP